MLTTNLKVFFFNIWVNAMKQYAFLKKLSPRLPDLQVTFLLKKLCNFVSTFLAVYRNDAQLRNVCVIV